MFDILLRGGWSVEEEQQFQAEFDRRYAEADLLLIRERSLYDGSFHAAAAGLELESYDDYDRAMRERQAHVVHLTGSRQRMGIEDTEEERDILSNHWSRGEHPLAKLLRGYETRPASHCRKRRTEIAYDVLEADMLLRTVHQTVPLRRANVVLANDAADDGDECIVNNDNIFYSNFCVDLTENMRAASSSCSILVACLTSSSSSDLITLMHNTET